jgi:hypothetical protein
VRNAILGGALLLLSFYSPRSEAVYKYILDFDGSIVRDGELTDPWRTPWVLVKVNGVTTSAQLSSTVVNAPRTIQVSFAEYTTHLNRWAKADQLLADLSPIELEEDPFLERPNVIIPGLYRVEPSQTFVYYRQSTERDNALEDYYAAKERLRSQGRDLNEFMGEAFPLLQKAMSRPETVGDVTIFTARDMDLQPLIDLWADEGHIVHSVGMNKRGREVTPRVNRLQGMESILHGRNLIEGKVGTVKEAARETSIGNSKKTWDYGAKNPELIEFGHTIIVVEDDPKNFMAVAEVMLELSAEYRLKETKYVLVNAASDSMISNLSRFSSSRWWVFYGGFARPATEKEVANYTSTEVLRNPNTALTCSGLL